MRAVPRAREGVGVLRRDTLGLLVGSTPTRPAELARLIASLEAHSLTDWRLHVGFMAPPETPIPMSCAHPHVSVLREWPRLGVSAGYNALARQAVGYGAEWLGWLNDDAEVEPGWDLAALRALKAEPQAGIAALPYLTPHPPAGWHVNTFPPGLPYANFGIFSREVFQRAGGFDPRVFMYGCDNALCFRILALGLGVLPVADARIVHHYREDPQRVDNMDQNDKRRAGWDACLSEWRPKLESLAATQARTVGTLEARGWRAVNAGGYVMDGTTDEYARRYGHPLERPAVASERTAVR